MKIYIPKLEKAKEIGGGNTFLRNFLKAGADFFEISPVLDDTIDIAFFWAPHVYERGDLDLIEQYKTKLAVRLDGVPEDSRNSGFGTKKLIEVIRHSDLLIYQSRFVQMSMGGLVSKYNKQTVIVHNGVDTKIFNPSGPTSSEIRDDKINIYVNHYRKDPNKRFEEVVEMFRMLNIYAPNQYRLILVGRYPTIWQEYGFGFFNNEDYLYLGVKNPEETAKIIRSCDIMFHPAFADPSPNSVLEAIACQLPVLCNKYSGAFELLSLSVEQSFDTYWGIDITFPHQWHNLIQNVMDIKYVPFNNFKEFFSIESMIKQYRMVFNDLLGIEG